MPREVSAGLDHPLIPEFPDDLPPACRPCSAAFGVAARSLVGSPNPRGRPTYLHARGITVRAMSSTLRFHPKCWHRGEGQTNSLPRPELIAAVPDGAGTLQGVNRTGLAPDGQDKAPVRVQRRAMGHLLTHAVRLTPASDILVLGKGLETMLSIREAPAGLPVWAALSAGHLGAVDLPQGLKRLYIALDRDPTGRRAAERLSTRAKDLGITPHVLEPRLGDFNDDLRALGPQALQAHLAEQLAPEDRGCLCG